MKTAQPLTNAMSVFANGILPDGVRYLETDCHNAIEYRNLPKACIFDGRQYGLTGWNSDRYVAYYRDDAVVAKAVQS